MTALEEYRASDLWEVMLPEATAEGTLFRPNVPVVRKALADAVITEFEADNEALLVKITDLMRERNEAQSELAEMKACNKALADVANEASRRADALEDSLSAAVVKRQRAEQRAEKATIELAEMKARRCESWDAE